MTMERKTGQSIFFRFFPSEGSDFFEQLVILRLLYTHQFLTKCHTQLLAGTAQQDSTASGWTRFPPLALPSTPWHDCGAVHHSHVPARASVRLPPPSPCFTSASRTPRFGLGGAETPEADFSKFRDFLGNPWDPYVCDNRRCRCRVGAGNFSGNTPIIKPCLLQWGRGERSRRRQ
jgi:hypothetical protein